MSHASVPKDVSPGWSKNPDYVIDLDPIPARVRAVFNGETIVDSADARVMFELGHAPVYYFPRDDLAMEYLRRTDHRTFCPYKGYASYWSLEIGDRLAENAAWSYEDPYEQVTTIRDLVGFYWGRMDAWYENDVAVAGPREIPGRIDTTNQLKALYPELAREWHPTRNEGIKPYEFAWSNAEVWWRDETGREWRERIKDRVLAADRLRGDGDATPYG